MPAGLQAEPEVAMLCLLIGLPSSIATSSTTAIGTPSTSSPNRVRSSRAAGLGSGPVGSGTKP